MKRKASFSQWTFGYGWDLQDNILRIELESASPNNEDDLYLTGLGMTAMHLFSRRDTAPFLGATIQSGTYSIYPEGDRESDDSEDFSGYIFGGNAGLLFFRNSEVNLEVAAYTRVLLERVDGRMPLVNGLKVGLYW